MIDENTVAVVAASCRAGTFSALTRDEHTDLVRSIILAYEAAKPAPMSTSGEMAFQEGLEAAAQYLEACDDYGDRNKAQDIRALKRVNPNA